MQFAQKVAEMAEERWAGRRPGAEGEARGDEQHGLSRGRRPGRARPEFALAGMPVDEPVEQSGVAPGRLNQRRR